MPMTQESFSPSAPASMDIFSNGQGAVCTKWLVKVLYSPFGICSGEKLRRCAAHTRSFFKTPCFRQAPKGDFLSPLRYVPDRTRSGFFPFFRHCFPPELRGPYTHALTFFRRRLFPMLFDCSDIDLLRLTGFLKNLPTGREGKYSLRLLTPSVLGPVSYTHLTLPTKLEV